MKIKVRTTSSILYCEMHKILNVKRSQNVVTSETAQYNWELTNSSQQFKITDWVCEQDSPMLLIVDAEDTATLDTLDASQIALQHLISTSRYRVLVRCPVILVFKNAYILSQFQELHKISTDWMLASSLATEAIPRILGALRKIHVVPAKPHPAALTLIPTTRAMVYDNASVRLTPAEYSLLELFLSNIGSIISLQELVQTFQASGKSTQANNIRVAIYQLRLKLDTLTKSQMPLTSIYRQGYCLRQKLRSTQLYTQNHITENQCNMQSSI